MLYSCYIFIACYIQVIFLLYFYCMLHSSYIFIIFLLHVILLLYFYYMFYSSYIFIIFLLHVIFLLYFYYMLYFYYIFITCYIFIIFLLHVIFLLYQYYIFIPCYIHIFIIFLLHVILKWTSACEYLLMQKINKEIIPPKKNLLTEIKSSSFIFCLFSSRMKTTAVEVSVIFPLFLSPLKKRFPACIRAIRDVLWDLRCCNNNATESVYSQLSVSLPPQ